MKDLLTGLKNVLGVFLKPGSYLNILYLLLAFLLGIFYFVYLITGFSIGLSLLYLFIGLPFLLLALAGPWQSAGVVLFGLLLFILSLHLFNGYVLVFRWLSGKLICA